MLRTFAKTFSLAVACACCWNAARPAAAYVDLAPTLGRLVREAQTIATVEVEKFSRERGAIVLKNVRELKGTLGSDPIRHQLIRSGEAAVSPAILDWAEPGRQAVLLISDRTALVCLGRSWYQVQRGADGWWTMGTSRPDLPLAYCGTVTRLADGVELMVAGKTAVITAMPHGADQEGAQVGASFDLALNRSALPGLVTLQRTRASTSMPPMVAIVAFDSPSHFIGFGQSGAEELPALLKKLQVTDATARAESAADLGSLEAQGKPAAAALAKLLDDRAPLVRLSAAAALCRIGERQKQALAVLEQGLASDNVPTRRHAARAIALAGPSAAALTDKLAVLLEDEDEIVRSAALQAIATLGPAGATAVNAVAKLLDDRELAAAAADALGRIGKAARPVVKRIAPLLTAEATSTRWAAVRGMSQVGGDDAYPAVEFMIKALKENSSEVDGYNMMIYLGLLGPVAKDAIPAMETARIKNQVLVMAAKWAIECDQRLPWEGGGGLGGMGGAEAGPPRWIFECYIHDLGDRLQPAVAPFAKKLIEGTAGNVPSWGYRLLNAAPDEAVAIFVPALADKELAQRQRATVALGFMGKSARAAKPAVEAALAKAENEREKKLLKWAMKEIGG